MKRRDFLELLASTTLGAMWLRRAFADVTVRDAPAVISGPTLVLVIPRDDAAKWARGRLFGELLNFGSDRDLAPLALVDVVCLPAAQLGVGGEPLLVYVDGEPRALDATLPPRRELHDEPSAQEEREEARLSDARIAVVSRLIRAAVASRRAADGRSDAALAELARARWVKQPPRGTHWAYAGGCGVTVEGAPELSDQVDCGMGHVPHRSARFLYFFTRGRR